MSEPLTREQVKESLDAIYEKQGAELYFVHRDAILAAFDDLRIKAEELEQQVHYLEHGAVLAEEVNIEAQLRAQLAQAKDDYDKKCDVGQSMLDDALRQFRQAKDELSAADIVAKQWESNAKFADSKLAQVTAEHKKLQHKIAQQRRVLAGKNQGWAETKLGLVRTIEHWRAKANGETPTFGHGSKLDHIKFVEHKLAEAERQRDAHANVASERRRELHEALARIKELEQALRLHLAVSLDDPILEVSDGD